MSRGTHVLVRGHKWDHDNGRCECGARPPSDRRTKYSKWQWSRDHRLEMK